MLKEVKYYNRAYKLLEELREVYKDGFNPQLTFNYLNDQRVHFMNDHDLMMERVNSLRITLLVAFLGLNKESIERADKFDSFKELEMDIDFQEFPVVVRGEIEKGFIMDDDGINMFNNNRTRNTIFDNWLSIVNAPAGDTDNITILSRVRNGLLHSNFKLFNDEDYRSFINIKTKNYYESNIIAENFHQFIMRYYSNASGYGLTEFDYICRYHAKSREDYLKVNNIDELFNELHKMEIISYNNKSNNYNGNNSFSKYFKHDYLDKSYTEKVLKRMEKDNIVINNINSRYLTENEIEIIIDRVISSNPNFFNMNNEDKHRLVLANIDFIINNKGAICSWISHVFLVTNNIYTIQNMNCNFMTPNFSDPSICKLAFSIIKAYLVMYRMQYINENNDPNSNKFINLDYNKINFDFSSNDYNLSVSNINDNSFCYQTLVSRQLQRDPELSQFEIDNNIILSIIRNGLAHGNINILYSKEKKQEIIKIVDINPKNTDEIKELTMTLEFFNTFLDSEAFKPKYCYNRNLTMN